VRGHLEGWVCGMVIEEVLCAGVYMGAVGLIWRDEKHRVMCYLRVLDCHYIGLDRDSR
jgi:hypothetical protein